MRKHYLQGYSGTCFDGNLFQPFMSNKGSKDDSLLYGIGIHQSFNCYSGIPEFESFPLRQLFLSRHRVFPSEWDTGYFSDQDIDTYLAQNNDKIHAIHYKKDGECIDNCYLYFGGKECLYVYVYNRGYAKEVNKYAICLLFSKKTKKIKKLIDYFSALTIPEDKEEGYLNILITWGNGFDLKKQPITVPDIDFSVNYNADFEPVHNLILEKLSMQHSKGLVLLHGRPGTGKTTYVRYLISVLKKKVIYIPPNMASSISNPDIIKFFLDQKNSVLLIEDAESVLLKRSGGESQAVANILNLTDGLLSDCANIQIVATFNTNLVGIDDALLRKGRLIAKYEFKELQEDRARKLGEKLGVSISGNHTLAEIYNANEKSFTEEKNKIGFK